MKRKKLVSLEHEKILNLLLRRPLLCWRRWTAIVFLQKDGIDDTASRLLIINTRLKASSAQIKFMCGKDILVILGS